MTAALWRDRELVRVAVGLGLAALFGWINVEIVNVFSASLEHYDFRVVTGSAARDLACSLIWGFYALGFLALGAVQRSDLMRWVSLAGLALTITKAFLYDLRELEGLFRIGSVFGLAIVLLAVSLAYQRLVFGRAEASA